MYNLSMKFPFLLTTLILSLNVFSDEVDDPFEDFNRKTFELNEKLDEKIAKPVAEKYAKLPPNIKIGISNFLIILKRLKHL